MMACQGCGEPTEQFVEGFCTECHQARQDALDEHNARFAWWERLSNAEREAHIRKTCNYA